MKQEPSSNTLSQSCPLCQYEQLDFYHQDKRRDYWQCRRCQLVFVPCHFHLSAEDEKAEYDKHENHLNDAGYLTFLSRMTTPMMKMFPVSSALKGLDFGCGPTPALAHVMRESGYDMAIYDLYYYPDNRIFDHQYHFITCTEVIEHIARPDKFIATLLNLLQADGTLGLMTKLVLNRERFAQWHYKNDPTHICFYSISTFTYIAQQHNLNLEFIGDDVIFLSKNATPMAQ